MATTTETSSRGGFRENAGRPPSENPKNAPYQLRMTADERDKLNRLAEAAGVTPADWLRERIRMAREKA